VDYRQHHQQAVPQARTSLRTENTVNHTHDVDIANRRLLGVQRLDHDLIIGAHDLHTETDPVVIEKDT
jgi:hypothetical protein